MPLYDNMKDSYKKMAKVTKVIKNSLMLVYAQYALARALSSILPSFIPRFTLS